MRKLILSSLFLTALAAVSFAQGAASRDDQVTKTNLSQPEIDQIVKAFTEKEAVFHKALNNYSFQRDATIQTLGILSGAITGEYTRRSLFTFDDKGVKYEKILYFPMPTMTEISITPADLEDLGGVNPFALEPKTVNQYNFTLVGKQKIDELDLYVFDVAPKVMPKYSLNGIRLFQGRVWVDDRDLQIVKSKGKGVPEDKNNKFPIVETWRENIGGKYWFPTFATSNDTLEFGNGQTVHEKMRVKYTDYKEATSTIRILDDDTDTQPSPTPSPAKKP